MVRTAATTVRASGGRSSKATKSSTPSANSYGTSSGDRHTIGGNSVHPRDTPSWQRPITSFFTKGVENKVSDIEPIENVEEMVEFLGEGSSGICNVDDIKTEIETISKENAIKNHEVVTENLSYQNDEEMDTAPKKKQKLDFYKHLEEIENNVG